MKVLITGTFCSGKSTLTADLDNRLSNFQKVSEPARELINTLPELKWNKDYIRMYLTVRQILLEKLEETKYQNIIVDAGTVSNIIHENVLCESNISEEIIKDFNYTKYDLILLCDYREINFYDDGKRITDLQLRELLHTKIVEYLKNKNLDFHLMKGNREERLISAVKHIEEC